MTTESILLISRIQSSTEHYINFGSEKANKSRLFASSNQATPPKSGLDRFKLWNYCGPVELLVEEIREDGKAIGLTKETITIAVRSRLRAARLYRHIDFGSSWPYLYTNVHVVGSAFSVRLEFNKKIVDSATLINSYATTWHSTSLGIHGQNSGYIISFVEQQTDRFIDEYLRVNANACK